MPPAPLSPEEIKQRFPVWRAFSDLFLDTDPALHYDYIVRVMRASPYTRDELRSILLDESTPAFRFNLSIPTGEWAGWSDDFIRKRTLAVLNRRRWFSRFFGHVRPPRDSYALEEWRFLLNLWDRQLQAEAGGQTSSAINGHIP